MVTLMMWLVLSSLFQFYLHSPEMFLQLWRKFVLQLTLLDLGTGILYPTFRITLSLMQCTRYVLFEPFSISQPDSELWFNTWKKKIYFMCFMSMWSSAKNSFLVLIRNTVNGDPRWCCTYLLNPSDPLFVELGAAFIKQQVKGVLKPIANSAGYFQKWYWGGMGVFLPISLYVSNFCWFTFCT